MSIVDKNELVERFTGWDYFVFIFMLLVSAAIGVFYGFFAKRKMKDTNTFLMAGRSMGTFPVAMSLIASFMSAISLLGIPSEVYQHGIIFVMISVCYIFVMPATAFLYLPVFWNLQVTSAYEYLEIRFCKAVRLIGSVCLILQMSIYMAIVIYAPSLALSQVTGINVYLSVCLVCFICIFYTTLGGMKAVLWTDSLQVFVMYGSTLFIMIYGALDVGGFQKVWEISATTNRTVLFTGDIDLRTRHTTSHLIFGGTIMWLSVYAVNQAQVQRYLCVREKSQAVKALLINLFGLIILVVITSITGLIIYVKYKDCDPISSGLVDKADQLLPLYVMETLGHFPGLPGLFVAGVFAGSLSTVSSGVNSLAAITLEAFIKAKWNLSERTATISSKFLSLFYGALTFGLVFAAEKMGDILSAAISISGILGGPILGVFTLGMFFPGANSKGALVGTLVSLAISLWIGIGAQIAIANKEIVNEKLPLTTCQIISLNGTLTAVSVENIPVNGTNSNEESDNKLLEVYKLSYLLYSTCGCFSTIIIGVLVSLITGLTNIRKLNPKLLSPVVMRLKCIIPRYSEIGIDYMEDIINLEYANELQMGNINPAFKDD